jgi:branched-chain amino acid transport system ATP-binding protein
LGWRRKLLKVERLEVFYGEFCALSNVSFEIMQEELVTIIGANGAGKTTILRALIGLETCRKGSIHFQGREVTHIPPHLRARMGITMVPEGRRIFPDLTVEENLRMGGFTQNKEEVEAELPRVLEVFPILKERSRQVGKTLSGGEQQMLAIARALMSKPLLILMDEISLGLMPKAVDEAFRIIQTLHRQGVTILLVEQNARKALSVADRGYVLETGRIVLSDKAEKLATNPQVKKAYLGGA